MNHIKFFSIYLYCQLTLDRPNELNHWGRFDLIFGHLHYQQLQNYTVIHQNKYDI